MHTITLKTDDNFFAMLNELVATLGVTRSNLIRNAVLSYKENLEKALFGELDAVVKYRKILGTMPSGNSYTLLMSIMTDELRHASKYNFLIHNAK